MGLGQFQNSKVGLGKIEGFDTLKHTMLLTTFAAAGLGNVLFASLDIVSVVW